MVDKTPSITVAQTYTPDSPKWRRLRSPSTYLFTNTGFEFKEIDMHTCVMARIDTTNDQFTVDNGSLLSILGNVDARTVATGTYDPGANRWFLDLSPGLPRYSPVLLAPLAVFDRTFIKYFSLLGSGYSLNDSYPNGTQLFSDNWLKTDFNQEGLVVNQDALFTGFVANNQGFIIKNDNRREVWQINNSQVYAKRKPFIGGFYGKFLTTTAEINKVDYGFVISESKDLALKTKEFYQYDTKSDTWTRKADFPGDDRTKGVFFGINDKIYYGLGQSKTQPKGFRDIWQYDTRTNLWSKFATYPGGGNIDVTTAMVAGKVYIGLGYYVDATTINTSKYIGANDFWEFVPNR